ncbi:MAG: hypothetical protein CM1200mP27_06960 [Chloroflexota bacterium]|nr:MAG: hypothetical protein CM1200mP27_06960 [Chloroflexota bacterium]
MGIQRDTRRFRRILSHRRVNYWELFRRLPATLLLAATALSIAGVTGIPLGVMAAVKQRSWLDSACRVLAIVGAAVPSYVLAPILMLIFAVQFQWLPAVGYGSFQNLILPAIAFHSEQWPNSCGSHDRAR